MPKENRVFDCLQTMICHLYSSETLASKETNRRTEKACPKPEDLEEGTLDTVVDGKTLRDPPTQRFISMEHGQKEVQPGIQLGRTWSKLPEDLSQRDRI
ncbi:hypothetical protein O181_090890 [Austropuccinia psidii MF-1]|uniref:Uncharacterized protein n=1 Tax=Austropuccinia psidii MF-1 TaxID=1389203 RepID=A0A9Q3IVV0_9BASI|nr:hypothetical protein [Austropuccinia psidii MF-1]